MEPTVLYLIAGTAAGLLAILALRSMLSRPAHDPGNDSPFAVSTEGMKICPKCGMGNMWTDRTCISCRAPLRG
jgi:hypothetical protein